MLTASATNHSASWTGKAACILSWDLFNLDNWLADIDDEEAESWCGLELDLMLTSVGWARGRAVVVATLSDGLRNPAFDGQGRRDRDVLVLRLAPEQLAASRARVAQAMLTFPPRGQLGATGLAGMRSRREARLRKRAER